MSSDTEASSAIRRNYQLSRWLAESPREGVWNRLHLVKGSHPKTTTSETSFYHILTKYGCVRNVPVHTGAAQQTQNRANQSSQDANVARSAKHSRSSLNLSLDPNQSDDSERDDDQRNLKRTKASQQPAQMGQRFACPFHKFNPVLYEDCSQWDCQTIETVKRHVLGAVHNTSPHMSPEKSIQIRSIRPIKTGAEDRWRIIFKKLFHISSDIVHLIPSPYRDGTVFVGDLIEDLEHETFTPSIRALWSISNPHAPRYLDEARRLVNRFEQRRSLVRSQRRVEQSRLRAIQARLEALNFEEQQLETDLMTNLVNLSNGYGRGESPYDLFARSPLVGTERTGVVTGLDELDQTPMPDEARIVGSPESERRQVVEEPGSAQPSIATDSGYGTTSSQHECTCQSMLAPFCSICGKWVEFPDDL